MTQKWSRLGPEPDRQACCRPGPSSHQWVIPQTGSKAHQPRTSPHIGPHLTAEPIEIKIDQLKPKTWSTII